MVDKNIVRNIQPTDSSDRYHPLMSGAVRMLDGSTHPADALAARAHDSDFGRHMREEQPLRYTGRYGYGDRATMLNDFGADLCPIGHQQELGWHMAQVIDKQRRLDPTFELSDDDAATLMFTCLIHDMGEMTHDDVLEATGAVVGDIPAGSKTPEDRLAEQNVRFFLYDTFYGDVDPTVMARAEAIIAHQDDTLLHELFEAAHEAQTLETALRGREVSEQLGWHDGHDVMPLIDNSEGRAWAALAMARIVVANHLSKFEEYGHYHHMAELLDSIDSDLELAA
jgi:hypothetical protein